LHERAAGEDHAAALLFSHDGLVFPIFLRVALATLIDKQQYAEYGTRCAKPTARMPTRVRAIRFIAE
jgi:hypothetical protein